MTSWISCSKFAISDSSSSLRKLLPEATVVFPYIFVIKNNKIKKIKCSLERNKAMKCTNGLQLEILLVYFCFLDSTREPDNAARLFFFSWFSYIPCIDMGNFPNEKERKKICRSIQVFLSFHQPP